LLFKNYFEQLDNNQQNTLAECGYIFDIKKFAIHDGPGLRTTIFFKGCPLRCWWCHNPESHKVLPEKFEGCNTRRGYNRQLTKNSNDIGAQISVQYLIDEIEKDRIFFDVSRGGVTFSGGEPFMQPKFLLSVLSECKRREINTVVDTSGYTQWKLFESVLDYTDLFLFDIKLIDSTLHEKYTGLPNKIILQNLLNLDRCSKQYYLRIPVIPGITDTETNVSLMIKFISTLKNVNGINLLAYHKTGDGKYDKYKKANFLPKTPVPSDEYMEELKFKFEKIHSNVKIGG
jgi:pyruvate formate lyase activating enzyme